MSNPNSKSDSTAPAAPTSKAESGITVIPLNGRLDALVATSLRERLTGLIDSGQSRLVVDLTEVEFVDSAGLAALVKGMKSARAVGGDLRLVAPNSEVAFRVFELTRFDRVFTISPDLAELEALASW